MPDESSFFGGRASDVNQSACRSDSEMTIGASKDRGSAQVPPSEMSTAITNPANPIRGGPSCDVQLRLMPPVLLVWSTAIISTSLSCLGYWFFRSTPRASAAIPSFLFVEAVFICLGVYWIARGWWRGWVNIGIGGLAVLSPALFILWGEMPMIAWVGSRKEVIPVRVVDDKDGTVIAGAAVRLYRHKEEDTSEGQTDALGEVRLAHDIQTFGCRSQLVDTAFIEIGLVTIEVDARGYERREESLDEFLPFCWDAHGPPIPQIEVRMVRKR